MIDRYFRPPEFWPTVITALTFALLVSLGVWQLHRLAWKEELLRKIDVANREAPLTALPTDTAEFPDLEFHKITLRGHFLHDKELYYTPAYHRSIFGYHVLTPFVLAGEKRTVLVDRGFVPADRRDPDTRPQSFPRGTVTVYGRLREPYAKHLATPANRPQDNLWFWADLSAMEHATHLELLPVIVQSLSTPGPIGGLPVAEEGMPSFPNDHLMYALTWFAMAGIALFIFAAYHRRPNAA